MADRGSLGETSTMEIPGSPLSRHDLAAIYAQMVRARLAGAEVREIHVSDRRLTSDGLRAFGLPVRRRADLGLNEGLIVSEGREPTPFDFEEA